MMMNHQDLSVEWTDNHKLDDGAKP